jgi:hypothetical protein
VARILGARDAVAESTGATIVDSAYSGCHQLSSDLERYMKFARIVFVGTDA